MATTSKTARSAQKMKPNESPAKVVATIRHANCVAINFAIASDTLKPSIPGALVLDHHKGDTFISLVCMEIRGLPFCGLPIVPKFCELSLRCFVSERNNPERRGALYLKSYASGSFGSWVLNNMIPHRHGSLAIKQNNQSGNGPPDLDFFWKIEGHENRMRIRGRDRITKKPAGSKHGFIIDHRSRYITNQGTTIGYDVAGPEWVYWDAAQANFTCDVRRLFGAEYVKPLAARPISVTLSEGNTVKLQDVRTV